jgi:ABC-2 type transport system ATP-binding protein/lipopolysaccharide transport system ATP-binding protein
MNPIVILDDITVRYRAADERVGTFKEFAIRTLKGQMQFKQFTALNNVSLQVYEGDTLGIIGRNGAGKSTLLKVVSRVLIPTGGRVRLKGRVSPLLELGAGFHPELTGMENIFLNGTLLGHSRKEIEERVDDIIEFSELGAFINSPIRTYSSGMVARLGFSISTSWKPDILIVDEILSVGDASFREKSSQRMKKFREQGTGILLVSHSAETILSLCNKAIWLERGAVMTYGDVKQVVKAYQDFQDENKKKGAQV